MERHASRNSAAASAPEHGASGRPDWVRAYIAILLVLDALSALAAGTAAVQLHANLDKLRVGHLVISYPVLVLGLVFVWVCALGLGGAYDAREIGNGSEEYRRVTNSAVRVVAVVALMSFAGRLELARGFVGTMPPVALGFTLIARYRARKWIHAQREKGRFTNKVVVVGSREHVVDLVRHLQRAPHAGFSVLGACVPGTGGTLTIDGVSIPVLGEPDEAERVIVEVEADVVAIADVVDRRSGALRRIAWALEGSGIDLIVVPALTDLAGPRIVIRPVAGLPLLHVEEPVLSGAARLFKEILDRCTAVVGLIVLSPLLLAIGVLVRVTSPGPALYRQTRVGKNGHHFTIWKFRTMYRDADLNLPLVAHLNETDSVLFKIRHDPRRTPFGQRLRRFSIDELPQLWQVAAGRMSIVGPRPPLPTEVEQYDEHTSRRLLVKPGLTGLWQVSGRAELSWDESVRLDLYYVENWSPALDVLILWKTFAAVFQGRGAF